jgi:hypothetical protein
MVAPAHYSGVWTLVGFRARAAGSRTYSSAALGVGASVLGSAGPCRLVSIVAVFISARAAAIACASWRRGAAQLRRGRNGGVVPVPARPPCCPNSDGAVCSFVMLSFVLQTHWYVVLPRNKLWKAGKGPIRCPVHTFMLWPGRSSKYPPLRGKV